MNEIMKKPKWISNPSAYSHNTDVVYFTGYQILDKFYNQSEGYSSLKEDYIPRELKEKNWKPEGDKTYKCWWYCTNPSDPSDSGHDILLYIKEVSDSDKALLIDEYKEKIISVLSKLSLQQLKDIFEYIKFKR